MAVSAVMPRRPRTMSLRRVRGTLIALLKAFTLSASGSRKSALRISPGCTGGRSRLRRVFMAVAQEWVVYDFNVIGTGAAPVEANPPPAVDPDRILASGNSPAGPACEQLGRLPQGEMLDHENV